MRYLIAAIAALLLAGCSPSAPGEPSELDRYTQLCRDKGGVISHVGTGWDFVEYGCIGVGGELLPKFRT